MSKAFFVTGTDTGVGKTLVSCALLQAANKRGLSTLGLKPLAAGADLVDGVWCNEDALFLQENASLKLAYEQINPVLLKQAMAPHIAAHNEGKRLSVDRLVGYCRGALQHKAGLCLLEGAGGWRVPLNKREHYSALPKELNLPVILVVGLRLGCLNHSLLTAETISRDGLQIAAWVANIIDPQMFALEENIDSLRRLLPFPCLGVIPELKGADFSALTAQATAYLNIEPLIQAL